MKIVFMGTPDFAAGILDAIVKAGYDVVGVVTQPDKPKGRRKEPVACPVKEVALREGLRVYQPQRVRNPEAVSEIESMGADLIVVAAFGQIIPKEILDLPKFGCINVHASLLPDYRGAAPIQWAVINGEKESGVTTMRMDAGLDTGDMILQEIIPLAPKETGGSLFDKLSETGAKLLIRTLEALENDTAQFVKQPKDSPTPYAAMLKKEMGRIDWGKDAASIECLIRGLNPWPSAYTTYQGKTLKIWAADVEEAVDVTGTADRALPGTIVEVTKKTLKVQTGNGLLSIKELQMEGKKRMETDAFLRGCSLIEGEKLG